MIVFKDRLKKLAIPFFILSVCSIGVFVRVQVIHHDLWLDELTTAWVVNDNFSKIFERCWINNLSPLYYIFVYISKLLFGFSESSLRIPSTIAFLSPIREQRETMLIEGKHRCRHPRSPENLVL